MKSFLTTAFLSLSICLFAHAEDAPAAIQKQCDTLLEATQENDLEKFETVCDDAMKEAMTPAVLAAVSKQVAAPMKKGYKTIYMGSLDHIKMTTYCWKIDYQDEATPDTLVQMTTVKDKVAGFLLQ